MTEKKSFFMNSPFRFFFSLFMAVILFLSSSMSAGAAVHYDGDLSYLLGFRSPRMFLEFFGNYTEDGTDRDNTIPYVFRGSSYMYFRIATVAGESGTIYPYLQGVVTKRITCTLSSQITGLTFSGVPRPYVSDSSLPDGVTAYISNLAGNTSEFTFDLCLSFDSVKASRPLRGGITIGFEAFGYASAHNFGSSYGVLTYNSSVAEDYAGSYGFGDNITDFDLGARYFYNNMDSQLSTQRSIDSHVTAINSNLTEQARNINNNLTNQFGNLIDAVYNQVHNDNANLEKLLKQNNDLTSQQISNDNTNTETLNTTLKNNSTAEIAAANSNSSKEISAANKNSQNEIDTANQNADDIMHSYDSGSQEDKNAQFDSSQKQLQETEDNLFGSASGYFSGLDFSLFDIAKFTSVVSSLSFVSGLLQSLYTKMGDFGLIVTVGMVIMIASKVIGVYRFSTGDHGKGG